ncbi:hypothetical protein M0805_008528 [Coniferiporia weirii]|nr:hypothetical protein M0805_008528 [Coniferiporia weirii]
MFKCALFARNICRRNVHTGELKTSRPSGVACTLQAFHGDNARLLSIVNKRIAERSELIANMGASSGSLDNKYGKRLKSLDPIYDAWCTLQNTRKSLVETASLLEDEDPDIRALASEEYKMLLVTQDNLIHDTLPRLLVPRSQTSDFSALLEIKPGVGGSEASLFLADLLRMYTRFANVREWSAKMITKEDREAGGLKTAILEVVGEGAFDLLRWESGVHRVQRVPATESSGRVHTSTVQVVVLPFSNSTESQVESDQLYDEKDVRIEVMRARGAGGQHVNKTESAVRLTHIPTGITVSMQDERSQHTNKARAFQVLRARLLDRKLQADTTERRETRRRLVKSADRSEKIRTYNFVQDRVTDHRTGMTLKNVSSIISGAGLQVLLDDIIADYQQGLVEDVLSG